MPSWTDDEGRCWFETDGVPCCQGGTTCPMHRRRKPRKSKAVEEAFKRGAEAMREAAAKVADDAATLAYENECSGLAESIEAQIRALPLPEGKP